MIFFFLTGGGGAACHLMLQPEAPRAQEAGRCCLACRVHRDRCVSHTHISALGQRTRDRCGRSMAPPLPLLPALRSPVPCAARRRMIILVGAQCSGKSTLTARLAEAGQAPPYPTTPHTAPSDFEGRGRVGSARRDRGPAGRGSARTRWGAGSGASWRRRSPCGRAAPSSSTAPTPPAGTGLPPPPSPLLSSSLSPSSPPIPPPSPTFLLSRSVVRFQTGAFLSVCVYEVCRVSRSGPVSTDSGGPPRLPSPPGGGGV